MVTEYKKEESGMTGYRLHPGEDETDRFSEMDIAAGDASNTEIKNIASDTQQFDQGRQFEYNMDGESLW